MPDSGWSNPNGARVTVTNEDTSSELSSQSSPYNTLILEHLEKVSAVARLLAQKLPPQFEWKELAQVGVLAMLQAAPRYRPGAGTFWSFVYLRVRGAMLDFCQVRCQFEPIDVETVIAKTQVRLSALMLQSPSMSARDRGIFEALSQGYGARAIAQQFGISEARVSQIRKRERSRLRPVA